MNFIKRLLSKPGKLWKKLGPGLITGASDDDPSGIATYSQAGAMYGTKLLWTALFTYPLIVAIQEMCARIGLVTDNGLMGTIKKHYPPYVVRIILCISFPSIALNIGADIAGMGAVGNMIFPLVPDYVFAAVFTAILLYCLIRWSYRRIATVLKWLCITLFCYIIIPFFIRTDWLSVLKNSIIPQFEWDRNYLMALVGILGTTISPYLFFWQASMEVEEENERKLVVDKRVIDNMETDIKGGLLLTNLVFYFIILTTGSVLFNAGIRNINTVEDAARALQPLAGDMAYVLFAIGVLGTGFLAIPVLGGSISYMMAETFNWSEGMNKKFHEAREFYITLIVSLGIGMVILFTGISPVKALMYTAVLYGIIAPVLIALILHICNNPVIMGKYTNNRMTNMLGGAALVIMTIAALGLLFFLVIQ